MREQHTDPSYKVGDRIRLRPSAQEMFRRGKKNSGRVAAVIWPLIKVRWDGNISLSSIHHDFVEHEPQP